MLKDISWRYFDFWLLGAVVLATAFGTTMIRSAVAGNEVLQPLINRQIYFALAGLLVIFLVAAIDYRYWMALYRPMYLVILIFLVTLTGFGQTAFGAQRWFQVGVLFLQPTEFAKIIGPLTDPVAHGGKAEDAFHVICPSLPGFAFSEKPKERGWSSQRMAEVIAKLMARDDVGQIWQHMAEDRVKVEIQNFVDFVSAHGGGRRSIAAAT